MRLLSIFIILLSLALTSCGTPKTTAQFYQTHKSRPGVTNFKLPGWLVWLGGGITYNSIKDEDTKAALRIARKVGKMRLMASENTGAIPQAEVEAFLGNIKQNGYDDLVFVKHESSIVNVMVKDNKSKIRNVMLMVHDQDGFVFLDLKTRIKYDEISDLINYFLKQEKEEEEQEEQEKAEEVPRA
jgi:hypothetical protein